MSAILDATNPDISRFAANPKRRMLIYHGWADPSIQPEPTMQYYRDVVKRSYGGNLDKARNQVRLFMVPGMGHCSGGAGPANWGDKLAPLIEWVEHGTAPDYVVARHSTAGTVDNERKVCAYPQRATYSGPNGGQNDPVNWKSANWTCR
jgi:tannase/feruloyl esterase